MNKLNIPQIRDDKTEILLIGSVPRIDLPSSLRVGHSSIPFSNAARNLGVIFDRPACIEGTGEQILSTCLPADQVDRFNPIVYLSFETIRTFVLSIALSRLDYSNALLPAPGSP